MSARPRTGAAIDVLFLDLGNVLAFHDNEKLFREMASAFEVPVEEVRIRLDDGVWGRANRGQLPGDRLRQELVLRLGKSVDEARWLELWSCHFTVNRAMVEAVESLAGRVPLALLSNTHDQHVDYLRPRLPVLERFEALILSCEVGAVKPEPRIFEHALRELRVEGHRAAFFDDVPEYARAAVRSGLQGHVFEDVESFARDLALLGVSL